MPDLADGSPLRLALADGRLDLADGSPLRLALAYGSPLRLAFGSLVCTHHSLSTSLPSSKTDVPRSCTLPPPYPE